MKLFDRNRKRLGVGGDEEEELPEDPEVLKIERITPFQHLERLKKTVAAETKTFAAPARNYMKQLHAKKFQTKLHERKEKQDNENKTLIRRKHKLTLSSLRRKQNCCGSC